MWLPRPIHWAEIAKLCIALGFVPDASKAEMLKLSKRLHEAVERGQIKKLYRGAYELPKQTINKENTDYVDHAF